MNKEEIVAIAVRLFAVALAIYGLNNLPGMVVFFNQAETKGTYYIFIALSILIFVVALLLWFFPLYVSSRIIPRSNLIIEKPNWNKEEILNCGFIILGIYFLFHVVSDAVYWFYIWKYSSTFEGARLELNIDQVARIYATIVEFVFVALLIFGSRGIANNILKLRYAGINSSNQDN